MAKQIFVNLPVKDLNKSKDFFSAIGFTFNPQFTDDNAACMIIGENIYAMLLVEKFFKSFTPKAISDAMTTTEVLIAIDAESREKVDEMIHNAIKAGGMEPRAPQDHGWMYGRSFQDLDGHIWEVFYMDESGFNQSLSK
jgi:predicted lactoylglutathione lyase